MRALFMERIIDGMMNKEETKGLQHPFKPVVDARSRALVLGSFPSVRSRNTAFYYGHPQNRFWKVLAALFAQSVPETIAEKTALLHRRHIALWDVVASCTIIGSADSALTPLKFNDVASCIRETDIRRVFANGQTAGKLYRAHLEKAAGIPVHILPSTSPANAAWTLERLMDAWLPLYDAVK
jgi:TDG/mug DNA glycosylase family protein